MSSLHEDSPVLVSVLMAMLVLVGMSVLVLVGMGMFMLVDEDPETKKKT
jgi:hypothetical protein